MDINIVTGVVTALSGAATALVRVATWLERPRQEPEIEGNGESKAASATIPAWIRWLLFACTLAVTGLTAALPFRMQPGPATVGDLLRVGAVLLGIVLVVYGWDLVLRFGSERAHSLRFEVLRHQCDRIEHRLRVADDVRDIQEAQALIQRIQGRSSNALEQHDPEENGSQET